MKISFAQKFLNKFYKFRYRKITPQTAKDIQNESVSGIYFVKVVGVYDGDTITVVKFDSWYRSTPYKYKVRMVGINAPELRPRNISNDKLKNKIKEDAKKSKIALEKLILNKVVLMHVIPGQSKTGRGKFGRILGEIYYNGINICDWMVDNNYAIKYMC
jgi:endonuclease YncB( thermonuclease family)